MNKRARLKRRILREHRRSANTVFLGKRISHWEKTARGWANWYCPHCWAPASASERLDGVPHAYR